jgi:hypothetical protein
MNRAQASRIRRLGRQARTTDLPRFCYYPPSTAASVYWLEGWDAADAETLANPIPAPRLASHPIQQIDYRTSSINPLS